MDPMERTLEMIALIQVSMMNLDPDSEIEAKFFLRLERIEHYLIRRYNRGVFEPTHVVVA